MNKKLIQEQIQEDLRKHAHLHPFDLINNKEMGSFHTREYLLDCFLFIEDETTCAMFKNPKAIKDYADELKESK
jgi:hypothetical protein